MSAEITVDLAIVGGGIAGLWLANLFAQRGYSLLVLEADVVGGGQSLASQGMIHGGLKYSLDGTTSAASRAISAMPARWRANLAGRGELDLRDIEPMSENYYLFAQDSTLGKLSSFLASKALRGRVSKLDPDDYPGIFKSPSFKGVVYAADDLVIDTQALLALLLERVANHTFRHLLRPGEIELNPNDVALNIGSRRIRARHLVLCAGAGNQPLIQGLGLSEPRMQLRALHQVLVRHNCPHAMFAHCLTGLSRAEPRLTITSHGTADSGVWYLGGALANSGVGRSPEDQAAYALDELRACVPWVSWDDAQLETLMIDRAEALGPNGDRPEEAFAEARGPLVVCWPTKLSLTPDLGDRVIALLHPPNANGSTKPALPLDLPGPSLGRPPWGA